MQKDILFYQANFDPEVNRLIDAFQKGDEKYKNIFKAKTLKIVLEILNLSTKPSEKEEWSVVYELVENVEYTNEEERRILSTYGIPFSNKYMHSLSFN